MRLVEGEGKVWCEGRYSFLSLPLYSDSGLHHETVLEEGQ